MAAKLILGKYEPRSQVGSGGSGSVIEAWDTVILRKVAIKCIALSTHREPAPAHRERNAAQAIDAPAQQRVPRHAAPLKVQQAKAMQNAGGTPVFVLPWESEEEATERFERTSAATQTPASDLQLPTPAYAVSDQTPGLDEARAVAKIIDENIVTLYDFGVEDDTAFLVMEYVEGVTLTQFLDQHDEDLTLDTIAAVFDSVAHALEVAHANKVLHLDIKPDNILINRQGQVKVTDFGLASLTDYRGFGHAGGGTVGYMPPEQMHREALDARCDEWAFASILYQMLVGDNPFLVATNNPLTVEDLQRAEAAIRETDLVLPSCLWDELDPRADDVLFRALDPVPAERFAGIAQFADAMAPYLGDPDVGYEDLRAFLAADAAPLQPEAAPGVFGVIGPSASQGFPGSADADGAAAGDEGVLRGFIGRIKRNREARRQRAAQLAQQQQLQMQLDDGYDDEAARYDGCYDERYGDYDDDRYEPPLGERAGRYAPDDGRPRQGQSGGILSHLKSDRAFSILGRLFAAVGSALVAGIAFANIPQMDGTASPAFWIIVACFAGGGLLLPSVAAALALVVLGGALCVHGAYILGVLLVLATVGWWYACARKGKARTNSALAYPVLGAVGFTSLAPLVTGYCLKLSETLATTCFGAFIALILAGFGSQDLLWWTSGGTFLIGSANVQSAVLALLLSPQTWCLIVSWILAAVVVSLGCASGKRLLVGLACIAGVLMLLIGLGAFEWIVSGRTQLFPPADMLVPTILAGVAMIAAGFTAVPDRSEES